MKNPNSSESEYRHKIRNLSESQYRQVMRDSLLFLAGWILITIGVAAWDWRVAMIMWGILICVNSLCPDFKTPSSRGEA